MFNRSSKKFAIKDLSMFHYAVVIVKNGLKTALTTILVLITGALTSTGLKGRIAVLLDPNVKLLVLFLIMQLLSVKQFGIILGK